MLVIRKRQCFMVRIYHIRDISINLFNPNEYLIDMVIFLFYVSLTNMDVTYSVTLVCPYVHTYVTLWLSSWFRSISCKVHMV